MIRVRQVKVDILNDKEEEWLDKISNKLHIKSNDIIEYVIRKKSIDARNKENVFYVYEFDVLTKFDNRILNRSKSNDILKAPDLEYKFEVSGDDEIKGRIVIVGSGPAGLFCAYLLAEAGYKPLIIEQGEEMDKRVKTVDSFFKNNQLNTLSNIQFGEGGAGTFSDGKLNTLVKDKFNRGRKVFEILVENGTNEDIMYLANPHIGTDVLRKVIKNIRNKIISMGGEFRFNTKLTDLVIKDNKLEGIIVNGKERIDSNVLVLAIGHSARETFYMLYDKGLEMKNKNFAVGLRIIHPQEMINKCQYGDYSKYLEPANYKLTHKCSNGRGVYSFCMCPGGYVVNASSEKNRLVVNGMSNNKRDSECSNSAIVVTVSENDYGNKLFAGVEFQRRLEEKAYELGDSYIPIQCLRDYYLDRETKSLGKVKPEILGKYKLSNLNSLLPVEITESIKEGIKAFDKKIPGFMMDDSILLGVESRTSSPVCIIRNDNFESNILGVYPGGEGAGYAGGITTAAIDGVKIAEEIGKKYNRMS